MPVKRFPKTRPQLIWFRIQQGINKLLPFSLAQINQNIAKLALKFMGQRFQRMASSGA
jgi:hypothetical protein